MIGKQQNQQIGQRMQSMSKIDFRIPSKVVGDYCGDSIQLTPEIETDSDMGSNNELKLSFSENVTPLLKQTVKSRQSPNPTQVVASKHKSKNSTTQAEYLQLNLVSPNHIFAKKSILSTKTYGTKTNLV